MGVSPKTRFPAEDASANFKLNSWKEIAAYLGRDPRTVQLWEKLEGFPVHRLNHNTRASVYAFTAEIDAWVSARSRQRPATLDEPSHPAPPSEPRAAIPRVILYSAAFLICCGLLATWIWHARRPRPVLSPQAPLLVVLPFENQTSTDDSLSDDLTDAVIADLGRIGKIAVIERHSADAFKGSHLPLSDIAAQLHATLVLKGRVAQVADQVQVTVELSSVPGNNHIWGATYTHKTVNSRPGTDGIASSIAVDMTRELTGSAPQVVFPADAVDPRARQDYLTGRFYWNQRDLPSLQKAISHFQQALVIDPRYADAYAGLAQTYGLMTDRGVLSNAEAFRRARQAAQTALSLDPNSGDAYSALAFATYRQDWAFARAEQYFRKAIEINPDSAVSHQWYGEFLGDLCRFDESIAELRKARDLDPLSPMVGADLADGYIHAGRLSEADDELKRVLDLHPDFIPAYQYRIGLYLRQRDFAAAEAAANTFFERSGDRGPLQAVEIRRLVAAGQTDQARESLRRLRSAHTGLALAPYESAQLLFETGQIDQGYAALEQAYRNHSWWLVTMLVDPGFDAVRNQPQFLEVARRVGLPAKPAQPLLARTR